MSDPSATTDPRAEALVERLEDRADYEDRVGVPHGGQVVLREAADFIASLSSLPVEQLRWIGSVDALAEEAESLRTWGPQDTSEGMAAYLAMEERLGQAEADLQGMVPEEQARALEAERDQARSIAAALEAENARLVARIEAVRAALNVHHGTEAMPAVVMLRKAVLAATEEAQR